jgi:hypothetical protein
MSLTLTDQQQAVVDHSLGPALVLAVASAGNVDRFSLPRPVSHLNGINLSTSYQHTGDAKRCLGRPFCDRFFGR